MSPPSTGRSARPLARQRSVDGGVPFLWPCVQAIPVLDLAAVRSRFPALASEAAFFDGPGGSQVPHSVIDAVAGYLRDSNANLGGAFRTSHASDDVMERVRVAAADFTGGEPAGIA